MRGDRIGPGIVFAPEKPLWGISHLPWWLQDLLYLKYLFVVSILPYITNLFKDLRVFFFSTKKISIKSFSNSCYEEQKMRKCWKGFMKPFPLSLFPSITIPPTVLSFLVPFGFLQFVPPSSPLKHSYFLSTCGTQGMGKKVEY